MTQVATIPSLDASELGAAPSTLFVCYSPDGVTYYPSPDDTTFEVLDPDTPGIVSVAPSTATNGGTVGPFTLTGDFTNDPKPTVAFSTDPTCPLSDLMARTPVTVSGSGSSQTGTISSVDFSQFPAPSDLYLCYSPDNTTFVPPPGEAKVTVTDVPAVDDISPHAAPNDTVVNDVTLDGYFGENPPNPHVAFSKVPDQCPYADLMGITPVTVTGTGSNQVLIGLTLLLKHNLPNHH
jgi:hypothetical protein